MTIPIPNHLEAIIPYEPGKPVEELQRELGLTDIVKLASNESPIGPPKASVEAMTKALMDSNRYPDDSYFRLKEKICQRMGVTPSMVAVGAGSSELIVLSSKAFLGPDDYAVISEQTFIMYWLSVQSINGNIIKVPLKNYTYDLEAMAEAIDDRVRMVFIANPNNPTGTMITADELNRFMNRIPDDVVVVYDEAYREFIDDPDYPDPMDHVNSGKNLIILRTFSKIYGLAAMRVGYAIGREDLIRQISRVRPPFNVTSAAAAAAVAALDADDHVEQLRQINRTGKEYLEREMKALGLKLVPSHTNFITVDLGSDGRAFSNELLKLGVIIRPLAAFGMPQAVRVSIGLPEENRKFIAALKKVLG